MSTWAFIFLSCPRGGACVRVGGTHRQRARYGARMPPPHTATASDDDHRPPTRSGGPTNDAASAAALQGLLAQTLALFPSPSLPELGQAIEDARARLAVYKERGNSGDQDPMATADDMLSRTNA